MRTKVLNKQCIRNKSIAMLAAVASAVILPQIFHAVGVISGMGNTLGTAFLPMHLPVLLAGFLAGPMAGVLAGLLSPVISFFISGMPAAVMVPFMMIELAGYGIAAGILSKIKMPFFLKLLLTQIAGRFLRAAAIVFSVYALGNTTIEISQIWNIVLVGLPGILLQWVLIPLLMYRFEGIKKYYE